MNILHSETLNRVIHCLKGLSLPAGILSVTANFIVWFTSNKLLQKLSSKLSDGNILATDNLPAVTQLGILQEINGKSEAMLLIFMSIYCKSDTVHHQGILQEISGKYEAILLLIMSIYC